jgi:gliding motility-associated-like protein
MTSYWAFGDGGTGTGSPITHTYGASGFYTVKLVVTDGNGCKDSLTRPSYIHVGAMVAAFTYPATACVGSTVVFTNTSTPFLLANWDFGDGGASTSGTGVHAYGTPGTYNVRLIVSDGTCADTIIHSITILPKPVATFTITPEKPCPPPATITYTSTVPPGSTVVWHYGDGGTGSGTTSTHTYSGIGVYTVSMIVTSPAGCIDTVKRLDTMLDLWLTIGATPISGCKPLTVNFNAAAFTSVPFVSTYPYGPLTYSWDFGDGSSPGSGATPSHTYTAVGTYNAVVTVTTGNGCTKTATINIHVGSPPVVTFTAAPRHICYGDSVVFTATVVSGPVDLFVWDFGDGGSSTSSTTITHTYSIPGIFTVTLTPYYLGCKGTPFILTNYITVDSPKAIIAHKYNCSPKTRVNFGDSSLGDDTHIWYFGDGGSSTADNPVHDYPALGTYTVMLTTYNISSGCRDTAYTIIDLFDLTLNIIASDTAICRNETVNFTSVVTGGVAASYEWYINGFIEPWNIYPTLLDTFNTTGWFTIRLITVDGHQCKDTITKTNYVIVAKPVANFSASPVSGCWNLPVLFTDASTDVMPGTFFTNFNWAFGDGGTASVGTPTVSHTYMSAGVYDVREIVTDNIGCKDTLTRPAYITVWRPVPSFYASTTTPCVNSNVTFTNTSGASTYIWRFGDGATSTVTSPTHAYTAPGLYNVTLVATDSHGCVDSITMPSYINVTKPNAAFNMSDSFSVCPPLNVSFTNLSTGATSYYWSFGDGNTSVVPSPTNLYLVPGADTVMLVATNIYGCKDTARRIVRLYGYAGAFSYSPLTGCVPLTVNFNAVVSNVSSLTWDFADGVVTTIATPSTATISHTYTLPGAYVPKLILSDNTGCQNSSVGLDTIKVDQITPKFTTNPNPICEKGTFTFIDSSTSYWMPVNSWLWQYDGTSSTLASPTHTLNAAGTYSVILTVTNAWGCTATIAKDIIVRPPPIIDAGPDTVVCVGDPATLLGTGGVSYVWDPPATLSCTSCNPTLATPTVQSTYTVVGTDVYGCKGTDTVTVGLRTHTFASGWGDTTVCRGTPVPLYDTGGTKFTWIPAAGLSSSTIWNPIAAPQATTTYTVIAQLGSCIPDTNYITVVVNPLPTVDAGPDQRLLAGSQAQIRATGTLMDQIRWSPSESLSCDSCIDPVASMSVTTTYKIDVKTEFGCPASDSVTIYIFCDNSQVFIPNSFTPNGDGQNDVFYPRGMGLKSIKTFRIYNRWGELLFEKEGINLNDASVGWDGFYSGGSPRPDVYVYLLEATCYTGETIFIKGDVTIIR